MKIQAFVSAASITRVCAYLSKASGILLLLFASIAWAQDVVVTLQSQPAQARAAQLTVYVVVLNTAMESRQIALPAEIPGRLLNEQQAWPVALRAEEGAQTVSIAPGQFARRPYRIELSQQAIGRVVLEIEQPAAASAVIEVRDPETSPTEASAKDIEPPPASRIERSFASRFAFHEPIYFVYGPEAPAAKFQFSFKYRLFGPDSAFSDSVPPSRGFYLAYTQRSLWDVGAESSPFYDTSYMPEIFFEWLAPDYGKKNKFSNWFHWLGFQTGVLHESNGRQGADSRSLNTVYLRPGLAFGNLEGWRVIVVPRFFSYIGASNDNADIARYRGYNDMQIVFGKNNGTQIGVGTRIGKLGDKGSVQVELTQPVRIPLIGLETYLDLQYFSGYGESLRLYNQKTSVWRAGISFVR